MKTTQKQVDALNVQVTIDIQPDDYAKPFQERLAKYRRQVEIKGFRKGMAPLSMVRRLYGDEALYRAVNELVGEELDKVAKERADFRVLGEPMPSKDQKELSWREGEPFVFQFDMAFVKKPAFSVGKEDKVTRYDITVSDKEIQQQVDQCLRQCGAMEETPKVTEDALVVADITNGTLSVEGVHVSIPHVAEKSRRAFLGKAAGDKVSVDVNAAFDNETDRAALLKVDKEALAGIDPKFTFTLVNVKAFKPAEEGQAVYDKIFGKGAVSTPEAFRQKLGEGVKAEHERLADLRLGRDMRTYFLRKADLKLPEAFFKRFLVHVNEGKFSPEEVDSQFSRACDEYRWDLVRSRVMELFDLKLTEAKVREEALHWAVGLFVSYGMGNVPQDILQKTADDALNDKNRRSRLEEAAMDDLVLAKLRDEITVESKAITREKFEAAAS